jgi:hypothetical protein
LFVAWPKWEEKDIFVSTSKKMIPPVAPMEGEPWVSPSKKAQGEEGSMFGGGLGGRIYGRGLEGKKGEWIGRWRKCREGEGEIFKNSMVPSNLDAPCYYEGKGFMRGICGRR